MIRVLVLALAVGFFGGKAWIVYNHGIQPFEFWLGGVVLTVIVSGAEFFGSKSVFVSVANGAASALCGAAGYFLSTI